ncbi:hypothetical protein RJ226_004030 [Enterobacter hormaechei]|nr:hypothetical protein [Enterobacter hormaechei]ELD3190818.1 hypothetical protein [Enterobacter hormaechei]
MSESNECKNDNVSEFGNVNILLSHKKFYGRPGSADGIIKNNVSNETLLQLSVLSFLSTEEKKFRRWFSLNFPERKGDFSNNYIYDRVQLLECWKLILSSKNTHMWAGNSMSASDSLSVLHQLLTHINDCSGDEHVESLFVKHTIQHARDDFKFKLYRAHKIFVSGKKIASYVSAFEKDAGFSVESYINVIYAIIARIWVKRNSEDFRVLKFSEWIIDLRQFSHDTGVELGLLTSIMESISFDLQEGAEFSASALNNPNNHSLFRNKPFLRLSPTEFLPVEGRLVEELVFDNLFHKVHLHSGKSKGFLDAFGADFEHYVQGLCQDACALKGAGLYEYIPEFSYGKPISKSPDAMILCPKDKALLALEVKSARYLDAILSGDNQTEAIDESLHKLLFKPWKQVHGSICKIVSERRHPKIIQSNSYLFASITMNEIPLSYIDPKIIINDTDSSSSFYSLGIHTFELLLLIMTQSHDYTINDALLHAYHERFKNKERVSIKTTLLRIYRYYNHPGLLDSAVMEFITKKHVAFFDGFRPSV